MTVDTNINLTLPKNILKAADAFIDETGAMSSPPSTNLQRAAQRAYVWGEKNPGALSPNQAAALDVISNGVGFIEAGTGRSARAARNGLSIALYGTKAR